MQTVILNVLTACALTLTGLPASDPPAAAVSGGEPALRLPQPPAASAPDPMPTIPTTPGVHFCTWTDSAGEHRFAVYVPTQEIAQPPYPLVVFLHGYGESGTDGVKQTSVGLLPAVLNQPKRWPCVILLPQKPEFEPLWPTQADVVLAEIRAVGDQFTIDPDRISLTGLSQGGNGTWMLAVRAPDMWSAIAPVCGFHRQTPADEIARAVKDIPTWAFHGLKDNVVPPNQTREIIDALKKAGASPKLTEYPDANHNSWDPAYRDPEFPKWLLTQKRGGK